MGQKIKICFVGKRSIYRNLYFKEKGFCASKGVEHVNDGYYETLGILYCIKLWRDKIVAKRFIPIIGRSYLVNAQNCQNASNY